MWEICLQHVLAQMGHRIYHVCQNILRRIAALQLV